MDRFEKMNCLSLLMMRLGWKLWSWKVKRKKKLKIRYSLIVEAKLKRLTRTQSSTIEKVLIRRRGWSQSTRAHQNGLRLSWWETVEVNVWFEVIKRQTCDCWTEEDVCTRPGWERERLERRLVESWAGDGQRVRWWGSGFKCWFTREMEAAGGEEEYWPLAWLVDGVCLRRRRLMGFNLPWIVARYSLIQVILTVLILLQELILNLNG